MLSSLVKEHQAKQAARKESQGKYESPAIKINIILVGARLWKNDETMEALVKKRNKVIRRKVMIDSAVRIPETIDYVSIKNIYCLWPSIQSLSNSRAYEPKS